MKALLKTLFCLVLAAGLASCAASGNRRNFQFGSRSNAPYYVAGGIVGGVIVGKVIDNITQAGVAKEAIRAHVVLEAPCKIGPRGNSRYESSEGDAEATTTTTLTPEDCAKLIAVRQQSATAQTPPSYRRPYYREPYYR